MPDMNNSIPTWMTVLADLALTLITIGFLALLYVMLPSPVTKSLNRHINPTAILNALVLRPAWLLYLAARHEQERPYKHAA
jgi:hypothetical protein